MAAYTTLLTTPEYLPGVLVVDHGLRTQGSKYPLVVMVTPEIAANESVRAVLDNRGIDIIEIDHLRPTNKHHSSNHYEARFADTWTKLRAFGLPGYKRLVLLDSDMIIMKNMDELFELPLGSDEIAAAHVCACNPRKLTHYPADWVPENCAFTAVKSPKDSPPTPSPTGPRPYSQLNSGTVVLNPSSELSNEIIQFLETTEKLPTFQFPDQDFLAEFFKGKWKPLPWYYNALKTLRIVHPPLWDDDEIRCLHYILKDKPWRKEAVENTSNEYSEVHGWWWDHYNKMSEDFKAANAKNWEFVDSLVGQ